jgi:hypothetical protein
MARRRVARWGAGGEDGVGGFQLASIASTDEARGSAQTCAAGGDWTGRRPTGDGEEVIGAANSWRFGSIPCTIRGRMWRRSCWAIWKSLGRTGTAPRHRIGGRRLGRSRGRRAVEARGPAGDVRVDQGMRRGWSWGGAVPKPRACCTAGDVLRPMSLRGDVNIIS